jgi:hypothetical protein
LKVRYHFTVKSKTRTAGIFPLTSGDAEINVSTDNEGIVTNISVGYRVDDSALWPTITETPNETTKFFIKMHSPFLDRAQNIVRAAEGALSFYGFEQIAWNEPQEEYVPETPEEESRLGIRSMSMSTKRADERNKEPVSFSIIATALLRTNVLAAHEIPLAFFRKGTNDANEDRYIEACIDFLFMLETLFANGKFKKNQVIAEFNSRPELLLAIRETKADPDLFQIAHHRDPRHGIKLNEKYMSQSVSTVIDNLVELRGFLHHHNQNRKNWWHPDRHNDFLADALFLQFVCSKVGLALFLEKAFTQQNKEEFLRCYELSKSSGLHT